MLRIQTVERFLNSVGRQWERVFRVEDWRVGVIERPIQDLLSYDPSIRWLPKLGLGWFLADPFAVPFGDRLLVVAEAYERKIARGRLAVLECDARGNPLSQWRLVDGGPEGHVSYPFPLVVDGESLLVPEASSSGELAAWRFAGRPDRLSRAFTVMRAPIVDGSLFQHEDCWWLLGGLATRSPERQLFAFYAAHLEGPWIEHPANPIVERSRHARMAGTPFRQEGRLYRPAQDCSRHYGGAVVLCEITSLTPTAYVEHEVRVIEPRDNLYRDGLHTLSSAGAITLVDGKRMIRGEYHPALLTLSLCGRAYGRIARLWAGSSGPGSQKGPGR